LRATPSTVRPEPFDVPTVRPEPFDVPTVRPEPFDVPTVRPELVEGHGRRTHDRLVEGQRLRAGFGGAAI